jgi:hypothetical protein
MAKGQLTDDEILARVLSKSKDAVGWAQQKLSTERERVAKYLNGEWPRRNSEGSSSFVSPDVYDSVRMQQSQLLEVFAAGDHIAKFDPDSQMSVSDCLVATEYASYCIWRKNDGYQIFSDVIYNGLTARAGVAKIYWCDDYEHTEEKFEGIDEGTAQGVAAHDDVHEFDGTQDPMSGLYSGTLTRKKDTSYVAIDVLLPEEFLIDPMARHIGQASYCAHRTPKTRAELIDMGFDKKLVADLPTDDAKELLFSPEVLARTGPTKAAETYDDAIQSDMDYLVYFESYVRMKIDPAKGVRLYKICHAGQKLLDEPQEVDKAPFLAYVPLPVPGVFYGDNFAARVVPVQNAKTVLMRGILDHTSITTNPRYAVVNGGLANPRELLDNRLGGIVNVRRPDSVAPLPQAPLNPYIYQTLTLLDTANEKSTGISALSQGLNKDAISTQNSQGLVDNMMKASGQRAKIMARNFADHFLVPLMIEVIRLAILHVKQPEFIEVGGAPLQCNVQDWTDRKTCTVSQHLGYGEQDMAANELMQGYHGMAQDPAIAHMFGPPQRYEMLKDIAKLKGFTRFQAYLNPNAPPPQPQPQDPAKMLAAQAAMTTAQAAQAKVQTDQYKEQRLAVHDQDKIDLQRQQMSLKGMTDARTSDRQDADTAHKIVHDNAQLDLEKAQIALDAHNQHMNLSQTAHDNHMNRLHTSYENEQNRQSSERQAKAKSQQKATIRE